MAGAQIISKNRPLDRKEKREECVLYAWTQNQGLEVCAHTEKGLCAHRKKEKCGGGSAAVAAAGNGAAAAIARQQWWWQ